MRNLSLQKFNFSSMFRLTPSSIHVVSEYDIAPHTLSGKWQSEASRLPLVHEALRVKGTGFTANTFVILPLTP